jgi:hypothetical protein
MGFVYVKTSSGRKKASKKTVEANRQHQQWLASLGYSKRSTLGVKAAEEIDQRPQRNVAPVSNDIPGACFKRSIDDYKWKGRQESKETIAEIERKKLRVAPAYNKGSTQYITEGADPKTLGRKI